MPASAVRTGTRSAIGPNETVDAAGNPVDKGPGAHLNFVANYFKNRTWGFEIIDNSRVRWRDQADAAREPVLPAGAEGRRPFVLSWLRSARRNRLRLDGLGAARESLVIRKRTCAVCPVVPKPPENQLANPSGLNDGCSVTVDNYPGHAELSPNADGVLAAQRQVHSGTRAEGGRCRGGVDVVLLHVRQAMAAVNDTGGSALLHQ